MIFFKQLGNLIISGCEITGANISAGIVGLSGKDANNNTVYKIAPFSGQTGVTFPVYLFLKCTHETREYADGNEKIVKEIFTAELSPTIPTGTDYLTINTSENRYFTDAIQDSNHRFMTDTERNKLSGIAEGANNYTHPAYTEKIPGLYKIEVDKLGHIITTATATKSDVGLGKVENVAALPLTGGTLTGNLTAPQLISNTTTASNSRKILGTDGGFYSVCAPSWETEYLNKIPIINENGAMWVGQEIKFNIPGSEANYDTRIYYDTSDGMMYYTNALSYFTRGLFNLKTYNGVEIRPYRGGQDC